MIAKIHPGNNFGGLVNYANDIEKKDAVVVASDGVSLASNAAITASFKAQAKTHFGVKDFVGHISLSFSPEDKEREIGLHVLREILWLPQIPDSDQYLQTTFDTMLRSHHFFFRMMENLRKEEFARKN